MKSLAPSPLRWPTWLRVAVVLGTMGGVSACIIGPKQDDPEALTVVGDPPDTAAPPAEDTGGKYTNDAGTGPFLEAGGEADAASDTAAPKSDTSTSDTSDASDASDASDSGDTNGASDAVASD